MLQRPPLIIFGGLPGTGKSTIAKAAARQLGLVYLRVDEIEPALLAEQMRSPHDCGAVVNMRNCTNSVIRSAENGHRAQNYYADGAAG